MQSRDGVRSGPGQRVGYLMLNLDRRGRDVRRLVHSLEGWIIATLAEFGVSAHRAPGRIGIWVGEGAAEAKIAALGIRIKRWVTAQSERVIANSRMGADYAAERMGLPASAVRRGLGTMRQPCYWGT
mgnify:CR=1 FL=1